MGVDEWGGRSVEWDEVGLVGVSIMGFFRGLDGLGEGGELGGGLRFGRA